MYIDIGKFGLLAVLFVGAYFGINPWWVPAVMLAWVYSIFIYIPWIGAKRRAAQQAVMQKQYLEQVMGRDIIDVDPKDIH